MIDIDGASVEDDMVSVQLGCTVFGVVVVETLDGIDVGGLVGVCVDDGDLVDDEGDNVTGEFEGEEVVGELVEGDTVDGDSVVG